MIVQKELGDLHYFVVKSSNNVELARSSYYKTKASMRKGIRALVKAVADGQIKTGQTKVVNTKQK